MALEKSIETNYGVDANYWKITNLTWLSSNKYQVEVSGWSSLEARNSLKIYLDRKYFISENILNTLEEAYNFLKQENILNQQTGKVEASPFYGSIDI